MERILGQLKKAWWLVGAVAWFIYTIFLHAVVGIYTPDPKGTVLLVGVVMFAVLAKTAREYAPASLPAKLAVVVSVMWFLFLAALDEPAYGYVRVMLWYGAVPVGAVWAVVWFRNAPVRAQ